MQVLYDLLLKGYSPRAQESLKCDCLAHHFGKLIKAL